MYEDIFSKISPLCAYKGCENPRHKGAGFSYRRRREATRVLVCEGSDPVRVASVVHRHGTGALGRLTLARAGRRVMP